MIIFFVIIALLALLAEGTMLLRILEWDTPVLYRTERLSWGFLLGCALSSYVLFWVFLLGAPIVSSTFILVHAVFLSVLGFLYFRKCNKKHTLLLKEKRGFRAMLHSLPLWGRFILAWIIVWTIVKILLGGYDLLFTPTYFNDTYANWNMRTKVFYEEQNLLLDRDITDEFFFGGRVPSYPLTVYFSKLWLVLAVGEWSEPVVNSIHFFWFLALLGAMFSAVRREGGILWAIIGIYTVVSLPLVLLHGVSAYTDVLMSAYVFVVGYGLYRLIESWHDGKYCNGVEGNQESEHTWLLLFSVMSAAMVFVKNEAMLIFLPPIALLFIIFAFKYGRMRSIIIWMSIVASVAVPWIIFKISQGLTFGNATGVSGLSLTPHEGVLFAIEGDLLYTGSYLLFFPLFILLLCMTWRFWIRHTVGVLVAFLLIVFTGVFFIYWLTPLAVEAIRHTGFGRGMVHLLPTGVFVAILLLRHIWKDIS